MSKLPTIKTILSGFFSTASLNSNFVALRDAFNNTLSRDGSTPNTMEADIDLNSHDLLNVGKITADDITVAGQPLAFQEGIAEVNAIAVEVEQAKLDAQAAAQAAQDAENSLLEWAGPWTTAKAYAPSDLASFDGSTYVCVVAHTSGVFATDFGAGKWQLFASKGSPGASTGDMLAANNLSELANKDTALTNLGGTVVGKAVFKATDAAAGQTALGLGSLSTKSSVTTAEIDAATLVTASETIGSNNNDTTIPTSAAVKGYVDGRGAPHAVLEDQKASGASGGSATSGSWLIRDLNTEVRDPSGIVSISANKFTVSVDCWCEADAPLQEVNLNQIRIYNVTDSSVVAYGTSEYASGSNGGGSRSSVVGFLTAAKTYQIEYRCETSKAALGLGVGNNFGGTNVFTRVKLWRA